MKRRDFIWLLETSAIWTTQSRAQQPLRTIALIGNTPAAFGRWQAALVERLGQLGWIEGRTLQVEYRWSDGRRERVVEIAAELVSKKVDLISTYGGAAVVMKQATASIPIVFVPAVDPVAAGLIVNFARPGGNVTGISVQQAEIGSKRVELLREVVPGLGKLAILFDANYPPSVREADNVEAATRQFGITLLRRGIHVAADLEPAFDAFKNRADAGRKLAARLTRYADRGDVLVFALPRGGVPVGYEVAKEIRRVEEGGRRIPIVAMTAYVLDGERERCIAAGMDDYLSKPVSTARLGEAMGRWMKMPEPSLDSDKVSGLKEIAKANPRFMSDITTLFREDALVRLHELRDSITAADPDRLARAAHALKSSSGNVGAKRIYTLCAAIEENARAGKIAGAKEFVDQVAAELDVAVAALTRSASEGGPSS